MDLGLEIEQCSTTHIGHLGLVMAQIKNLGIMEIIDRILPIAEGHNSKVSHGERVAAMILNGKGFIDNRLYLFPDFLDDKPLERLFGKPMDSQWFNDDALGRCLDAISDCNSPRS